MTTLDRATKERQNAARSRAGHIRYAMQTMAGAVRHLAKAREEGDHLTLGYKTWTEYIDGEFGAERLKLAPDERRRYVEMLSLAGASQREIGHTLGVSHTQVKRDLGGTYVPPEDQEQAARPPVVEAVHQAIADATDRAQDHRSDTTGEAETPARVSAAEGADCAAPSAPDHRDLTGPGAPEPDSVPPIPSPALDEAANSSAAPEGVGASSDHTAPAPSGPPCEKCGGEIDPDSWAEGLLRCGYCDPAGVHIPDDNGNCAICNCPTCGQRMPT